VLSCQSSGHSKPFEQDEVKKRPQRRGLRQYRGQSLPSPIVNTEATKQTERLEQDQDETRIEGRRGARELCFRSPTVESQDSLFRLMLSTTRAPWRGHYHASDPNSPTLGLVALDPLAALAVWQRRSWAVAFNGLLLAVAVLTARMALADL
jgi:hypothetical protein